MGKNVIVYILFIECCQHTNDLYWKSVFKDMAYGNPPYGTYFSNNKLCCNYKGKEFIYNIDLNKSSELVFQEIHHILNNTFGLYSQEETLQRKRHINTLNETNEDDWLSIKKQSKLFMIQKFCMKAKQDFNLSLYTTKLLHSIITIGLLFKTILPQHIQYKHNHIISIQGIHISQNSFTYDKHIIQLKQTKGNIHQIQFDNVVMSDEWAKYIYSIKQKSKGRKIK